jgi:hypothetical protein
LLASVTLDDIVKVIDVSHLANRSKSTTFDEEAYEKSVEHKLKANHGKIFNGDAAMGEGEEKKEGDEGDWSDDSDDDSDSDSDESMDGKKEPKKDKDLNPKGKPSQKNSNKLM